MVVDLALCSGIPAVQAQRKLGLVVDNIPRVRFARVKEAKQF